MLATSKVPKRILPKLEKEIKMMLHAHRDCLRTRWEVKQNGAGCEDAYDPKIISFDCTDGYYGEAFGILRAMECAGWGKASGAVNVDSVGNLRYWFDKLCDAVLVEENHPGLSGRFHGGPWPKGNGSGECDHCLTRYGKDDAGRTMDWQERRKAMGI